MAGKTVGEILKEQGITGERAEDGKKEEKKEKLEERKISFLGEIKIRQLVMDLEKLKAQVQGLREIKFSSDERIKELAENIGEIRSMVFQKDSLVKELETKIKLMEDNISDVEPRKIEKELQKKEERIARAEAEAEKIERMYKDVVKRVEDSQKILEGIKSVENLRERIKQMEDMVSKSIETKAEVERFSSKTEKIYTEIEDRIKEFSKLKTDIEKLDDLSKELTKSVDAINIRTVGFAKKEDIESFKNTINDLVIANKEKMEKKLKDIEESLNIPKEELTSQLEQLQKKRQSILNLISSVEEQYRKGDIKEETFKEVREKNEMLLNKLDNDVKRLEGQRGLSLKSLPTVMNDIQDEIKILEERTANIEGEIESSKNLESRTYVLENSLEEIKRDLKQINPEKMVRMANAIDIQTEIVNDILSKLKEVNRRLMDAKVNLSDYENRTRFFEVLNIIIRMRSINDISVYLNELEKIMLEMRLDKIWNEEKQKLTETLLMELSEHWHDHDRDDISKVFKDFLEKINVSKITAK
ncbi:MAG: hypothetical protein GTN36_02520 [Candidatus Aenigmarchaeota archaeon]|nr:hypothetical protein [Candidatus Aenigmarchaeota archaeon]